MYYRKNEQRNQIRDCTLSMQEEGGGGGGFLWDPWNILGIY